MAYTLYKENQHLYINNTEVRGVQSTAIDYGFGLVPYKHIGNRNIPLIQDGPQVGKLSVNYFLVGEDIFLPLTGNTGIHGCIVDNHKVFSENNLAFSGAYLTSYNLKGAVGQIPQGNAEFTIFEDAGKFEPEEIHTFYSAMSGTALPALNIITPGSIELTANDFNTDKIYEFDITIFVNRYPVYTIGSRRPDTVDIMWPIQASCAFTLTRADYEAYKLRYPPWYTRNMNFTLTFKNYETNAVVFTLPLTNLTLTNESFSSDVTNKSLARLIYQTYITNSDRLTATRTTNSIVGTAKMREYRFTYFRSGLAKIARQPIQLQHGRSCLVGRLFGDNFESYSVGTVTTLNGPSGMSGIWSFKTPSIG